MKPNIIARTERIRGLLHRVDEIDAQIKREQAEFDEGADAERARDDWPFFLLRQRGYSPTPELIAEKIRCLEQAKSEMRTEYRANKPKRSHGPAYYAKHRGTQYKARDDYHA